MEIYLNGQLVDQAHAKVSIFDHGFLYGDGAFEGIRAYKRLVFRLKEHIDRLYETCESLIIDVPLTKEEMEGVIVETLKANDLRDAYIRVIVSRGEGDLGLDPKKCLGKPAVIVIADKITLYPKELYKKGMEIVTATTIRNHPGALNPTLKSLNYLNNILAKIEATESGHMEAIMLDYEGYVAECTGDNIFIVKENVLITPNRGILKGITRAAVLQLAQEANIKTEERLVTRDEVYAAEECFLTGTAAEVIPVVSIDGKRIADGNPGTMTTQLITSFHELTKTDGVKY